MSSSHFSVAVGKVAAGEDQRYLPPLGARLNPSSLQTWPYQHMVCYLDTLCALLVFIL